MNGSGTDNPASRLRTRMIVLLWLAGLVGGFVLLERYTLGPGSARATPPTWPAATALHRTDQVHNLIMFVHPQCPCTRASVAMLNRLMTKLAKPVEIQVVFVIPPGGAPGFERGVLWNRVGAFKGVRRVVDHGGRDSTVVGVRTSGHVVLYDTDGDLMFSGGITSSRGHEGVNEGFRAVLLWINDGHYPQSTTPVYGCSILGAGS